MQNLGSFGSAIRGRIVTIFVLLPRNQGKYSHCQKYLGTIWQYRYRSTAYSSRGSYNTYLGSFDSVITGRLVIIYCYTAREPRQVKHYLKFLGYCILCQYKYSNIAHGSLGSFNTYLGSLGNATTGRIVIIYCFTAKEPRQVQPLSEVPWYTLAI